MSQTCFHHPVLSQQGLLADTRFVRYLKYLLYWRQPSYAKHLLYPQCLAILEMLQDPDFRKRIGTQQGLLEFQRQQSFAWVRARFYAQQIYFARRHRDLHGFQHLSLCYTLKEMKEQAEQSQQA